MRRQGSRMDRRAYSSRDDTRRDRRRERSRSRPRSRRRRERSRSRSRERAPPRSGGWGPPPTTGWGAPPVAQQGSTGGGWAAPPVAQQGSTQGGWAASAPLAPVAPAAEPKNNAEDVLRDFVLKGTCCTEANPRCPISRRCGQSHHFPEATREEDCNDKGWKLKSVKALYCHCRSRSESGEHYHKVVLFVHGVDC